jgi:elongation factor Ts
VGVVVEVNAETDFVGKNEKFVDFVKGVAQTVAKNNPADLDALMNDKYQRHRPDRHPAAAGDGPGHRREHQGPPLCPLCGRRLCALCPRRRQDRRAGEPGAVSGGIDATEIGKDVAMQIAALNPRFWDKSQVTQDVLDEEKKVMLAQMANDPKMASKPDKVKESIVMGKLNKFYAENCLLQQEFVKDNTMSVEKYIASAAKALGGTVTFKDAVRFEKGEGIEKKKEDFAAEIASMVK